MKLVDLYKKYILLCYLDIKSFCSGEKSGVQSQLSNPSIGSAGSKTTTEPNIDFELDIKVFIDSGKCVLHPKDSKEDELKR